MFSLIMTVQSIALVSRLCMSELKARLKSYLTQFVQIQADDDYTIPSLIWPPPMLVRLTTILTRVQS